MNLVAWGLLFILGFSVAFILGMHLMQLGKRPRAALLASLAGRWSGRVREGGILTGDRLELCVDEVPAEVTFGEGPQATWESAGWTRVHFAWPSDRRLRVSPQATAGHRLRRLFGATDIEFDDPSFDDRFWVESSHPTWARAVLDPESRRALVRLQWAPNGPFSDALTLDIGSTGVSMRVSRILVDNGEALGWFIESSVAILRKAMRLADTSGVTLEPALAMEGSACPVCGHPVADEALPCPSCRTPHHRDCWRYFGGCAIFGCRTRVKC